MTHHSHLFALLHGPTWPNSGITEQADGMKVGLPLLLTTVATHQHMVQNSVLPACAFEDNLNDGSTCPCLGHAC